MAKYRIKVTQLGNKVRYMPQQLFLKFFWFDMANMHSGTTDSEASALNCINDKILSDAIQIELNETFKPYIIDIN